MLIYTYYPDELYHHGIKGQKWGVRRFQNEDGSYKSRPKGSYESLKRKVNATKSDIRKAKADYNAYLNKNKVMSKSGKMVYKRKDAVKFRDSSSLKKGARAAIAVGTLGTGKTVSRFAANHKKGLKAVNTFLAAFGATNALLNKGDVALAINAGKALVARNLMLEANDILYNELYMKK